MCCGNQKTMKTIKEVGEMNARLKKDFNTKSILDLLEQVSKQVSANKAQSEKNKEQA